MRTPAAGLKQKYKRTKLVLIQEQRADTDARAIGARSTQNAGRMVWRGTPSRQDLKSSVTFRDGGMVSNPGGGGR
jgi:hypothetical protein